MRKHCAIPSRKKKRQEAALQLFAPPRGALPDVCSMSGPETLTIGTLPTIRPQVRFRKGVSQIVLGRAGRLGMPSRFPIRTCLPDFGVPLPPSAVCWK